VRTTDTTNPNGATEVPHPNGNGATEETDTASTSTARAAARPIYSLRFKLLAAVVVAAAIASFAFAALNVDEGSDAVPPGRADYVEALIPAEDSQIPSQSTVGIDLAPGWEGTLVIDGVEIPEDQLNAERRDLYRVEFTPGEGQAFETLPRGPQCITARVWPISVGRDNGAENVTWCFEVI
jgi:hypothetical protein